MQLRMARLCLDCEEVHDAQHCPVCASESFAFLSRWIPSPERRARSRPAVEDTSIDHERLEAVRSLTTSRGLSTGRVLTGGVVGLTALSLLGWMWQRSGPPAARTARTAPLDRPGEAARDETLPGER
jgi:hypothetical protein